MAALRWLVSARTSGEFRILMVRNEKARTEAIRAADHLHRDGHPLGWVYAVTTPDRWHNTQEHVHKLTQQMHPIPTVLVGVDDVDRVMAAAFKFPPHFMVGMITADKEE